MVRCAVTCPPSHPGGGFNLKAKEQRTADEPMRIH